MKKARNVGRDKNKKWNAKKQCKIKCYQIFAYGM